jgi:hypothetical protein
LHSESSLEDLLFLLYVDSRTASNMVCQVYRGPVISTLCRCPRYQCVLIDLSYPLMGDKKNNGNEDNSSFRCFFMYLMLHSIWVKQNQFSRNLISGKLMIYINSIISPKRLIDFKISHLIHLILYADMNIVISIKPTVCLHLFPLLNVLYLPKC